MGLCWGSLTSVTSCDGAVLGLSDECDETWQAYGCSDRHLVRRLVAAHAFPWSGARFRAPSGAGCTGTHCHALPLWGRHGAMLRRPCSTLAPWLRWPRRICGLRNYALGTSPEPRGRAQSQSAEGAAEKASPFGTLVAYREFLPVGATILPPPWSPGTALGEVAVKDNRCGKYSSLNAMLKIV